MTSLTGIADGDVPDGGRFLLPDLKTVGERYTLTDAQPDDTGIYVCKASNGVPPPEQAKIRVLVKGGSPAAALQGVV